MHEQDIELEPAHHARRPMNAFLIFCKRHRSVVRDKYPNLENRSITKILGEWWANLDKEEKSCYTGLAKQYKDAFFSANPDFKWYKLPAPPLRTLSARPRESPTEKSCEPPNPEYHETDLEKTNNNSTKLDLNKNSTQDDFESEPKHSSMFTPGKLADEAHMGGLSSLMANKTDPQTPGNNLYSPFSYKFSAISTPNEFRSHNIIEGVKSREENIRELQNALTETTRVFEEGFEPDDDRKYGVGDRNEQFTNQDVINQVVDNRLSKDDEYGYQRVYSDDEKNSKSGRSCKGKRYQEFMAVGGLIVNKRARKDYADNINDEGYSPSCSWDPGSIHEQTVVTENSEQINYHSENSAENEMKNDKADTPESDNNTNKTFKAADFDLDAKIKALPSLSLEKFQQKKRENKRKKKTINLKPKFDSVNSKPRTADDRRELVENWRETVIGSQKRKPRKISITRLEINSMISTADMSMYKVSPEMKIAMEAPCTVVHSMEACKPPAHGDLFALATLAEVAANTSKIENTSILDNLTAKSGDDNASTV